MPIFFLLNVLGLFFLLYVLANFWREGRMKKTVQRHTAHAQRPRDFEPIIVTHPISHHAQGGISVIPVRPLALDQQAGDSAAHARLNHRRVGVHHPVVEMPLRGISTNSAAESQPRCARIAAKDGPRC